MNKLQTCISSHLHIPLQELADIDAAFEAHAFKKGEYLVEVGQIVKHLAYIEEGVLRLYNLADGNEVTLWIAMEESFITSLSSFIFETPSLWSIQALTDCKLSLITRSKHFELLEKYPKWLEFDNIILARAFSLLEQRMFAHLHTTSQQRFEQLLKENPGIFNRVPLQYIASMLGITPETLSRLRRNLVS